MLVFDIVSINKVQVNLTKDYEGDEYTRNISKATSANKLSAMHEYLKSLNIKCE